VYLLEALLPTPLLNADQIPRKWECEQIETLTASTGERAAQRVSYSRWMNT
jgi:hypothetical protein